MKELHMGVVQMDSQGDKRENLKKMECFIRKAADKGCDMVAFPECSHYIGEDRKGAAEEIPGGETFQLLSRLARETGLWIHGGSIYEKGPKPWNTSVVINPQGKLAAIYRKLHLFDVAIEKGPQVTESANIAKGEEIITLDTGALGHFGLAICYDLRFPELFRAMALKGANLLFLPANFTEKTGEAHWEILLRARAIENGCYVIAPGQTGKKKEFTAYGHSMILDPWGRVLAKADTKETLLSATLNLDLPKGIQEQTGTLKNRRTDHYLLTWF